MKLKQGQKFVCPKGEIWVLYDVIAIRYIFGRENGMEMVLNLDSPTEEIFMGVEREVFEEYFTPYVEEDPKLEIQRNYLEKVFALPAQRGNPT